MKIACFGLAIVKRIVITGVVVLFALGLGACDPGFSSDSDNADLAILVIDEGVLSPTFSSETLKYTASVGNSVEEIKITLDTDSDEASIKVNDKEVTRRSTTTYTLAALEPEKNTFTIVVTAENGDTKEYELVVTRSATLITDTTLKSLEITGIDVGFSTEKETYSGLSANFLFSSLDFSIETTATVDSVLLDGTKMTAVGSNVYHSTRAIGDGEFPIIVKAEGGSGNYSVDVTRQAITELISSYNKAQDIRAEDAFGKSVAIDGSTVIVGVPNDDNSSTTITALSGGGDVTLDDNAADSGSVYVLTRATVDDWQYEAYVKATQSVAGMQFGSSVSISGDMLVVGAPEKSNAQGAAYVFQRTGTEWVQEAELLAPDAAANNQFGLSVFTNGEEIFVGAPGSDGGAGKVYLFVKDDGDWDEGTALASPEGRAIKEFGHALAGDEDELVIGAPTAGTGGEVYVYRQGGEVWAYTEQPVFDENNTDENDRFGHSVAFYRDHIVVGAHGEDSNLTGVNVESSTNNAQADSGAAYVFVRDASEWRMEAFIKAAEPQDNMTFGASVALFGYTLAVGAPAENGPKLESNEGIAVEESDGTDIGNSGAVYLYEYSGDSWGTKSVAYIKSEEPVAGDNFGASMAISEGRLVIGVAQQDSNDPDAAEGSGASNSGAVFVIE